jgi:hypothetical protein
MTVSFGPDVTYLIALAFHDDNGEQVVRPLYVTRDQAMAETVRRYVEKQSARKAAIAQTRQQSYAAVFEALKTLPNDLALRLEAAMKRVFQETADDGIPREFGAGANVVVLDMPEVTSVADVET